MKGANKKFMSEKDRFLKNNILVIQGALQGLLSGSAQLNNGLARAQEVDETHFGGT